MSKLFFSCIIVQILFVEKASALGELAVKFGFEMDSVVHLTPRLVFDLKCWEAVKRFSKLCVCIVQFEGYKSI